MGPVHSDTVVGFPSFTRQLSIMVPIRGQRRHDLASTWGFQNLQAGQRRGERRWGRTLSDLHPNVHAAVRPVGVHVRLTD